MTELHYRMIKTFEDLIKLSNTMEQVDFYHKQIEVILTHQLEIKVTGL